MSLPLSKSERKFPTIVELDLQSLELPADIIVLGGVATGKSWLLKHLAANVSKKVSRFYVLDRYGSVNTANLASNVVIEQSLDTTIASLSPATPATETRCVIVDDHYTFMQTSEDRESFNQLWRLCMDQNVSIMRGTCSLEEQVNSNQMIGIMTRSANETLIRSAYENVFYKHYPSLQMFRNHLRELASCGTCLFDYCDCLYIVRRRDTI